MKWIAFKVGGRESFGIVKGDKIIDISAFFCRVRVSEESGGTHF